MTAMPPPRLYQNHHLDNTRWAHVPARDDDIVVVTSLKSGTTWTQNIVLHLIHQDLVTRERSEHSPWIELRIIPAEAMAAKLTAMESRRCLKSHMPFDGLPFSPMTRYVMPCRDPRDVFMSFWNHYSALMPKMYADLNDTPGRVGPPLPGCPDDIRICWRDWITRGWFEGETEGWPFWSNMGLVQSWWDQRDRPNVLMIHYNDMLSDLPRGIARIADHLEIDATPEMIESIAEVTSFKAMKTHAESRDTSGEERFAGGAGRFIFKGTNGRWRDVLDADDLALYETAAARVLSPDCRAWLEGRGPA